MNQSEQDPLKAQNIFRATIVQAGRSDPAVVAPLIARFQGVGEQTAGLSPAQAAGVVAGATGLGINPDEAITGIRNVALAISGQGTPEGNKRLRRAGVDRSDFLEALQQISDAVQAGKLKPADLEVIGGRESVSVLSKLADPSALSDFRAKVRAVEEAAQSPDSLIQQALQSQLAVDPLQQFNLGLKRAEAEESTLRAQDRKAQELELARKVYEVEMLKLAAQGKAGVRGAGAPMASSLFNFYTSLMSPDTALSVFGETETPQGQAVLQALRAFREAGRRQRTLGIGEASKPTPPAATGASPDTQPRPEFIPDAEPPSPSSSREISGGVDTGLFLPGGPASQSRQLRQRLFRTGPRSTLERSSATAAMTRCVWSDRRKRFGSGGSQGEPGDISDAIRGEGHGYLMR